MFFRIVKVLCKLFGMAYVVESIREKLGRLIYTFQHNLQTQAKKLGGILLLGCLIFILFSLGLRFLLLGLAYWLNMLLSSAYLGFFIISFFCFLMVACMVFLLRRKISNQAVQQEKITDDQ